MSDETVLILDDLRKVMSNIQFLITLFGATAEFVNEYNRLIHEAGQGIVEGFSLDLKPSQAVVELPGYFVLPEGKAVEAYHAMKAMYDKEKAKQRK